MHHICPKCSSDQIQTFRMAYEGGTSDQTSHTTGVGVGLVGGNLGVGVGGGTTRSSSITRLAQKVSPPRQKFTPSFLQWIVCGVIFFPVLLVLAYFHIRNSGWNRKEWPKLMEQWENSWLCFRCGHSFSIN